MEELKTKANTLAEQMKELIIPSVE
jgi:hypothetical protein